MINGMNYQKNIVGKAPVYNITYDSGHQSEHEKWFSVLTNLRSAKENSAMHMNFLLEGEKK